MTVWNGPALKRDVTIHYNVSPLEPSSNEINSFWFADAASLVCDLERKLGIRHGMGDLIDRINALGSDELHAHADPSDEEMLVVAETQEILESLIRGISTSMERKATIENGTMSDAEIIATAEGFDVSGVSHDMMHPSTIALAEAAWAARERIEPTGSDMVRIHVLGGFDPFGNVKRRDNHFLDIPRSDVTVNDEGVETGDCRIAFDDPNDPIDCIDIVEKRALEGDALTEARTLFDRNVLRLEETSRMFHHEGLCVGQDAERPKIESMTAGSIVVTDVDATITDEDGTVPLFAWADVAKVTGTEGTAEEGLHAYVPLRVFLLDGTVIEIHGRVVWECFS